MTGAHSSLVVKSALGSTCSHQMWKDMSGTNKRYRKPTMSQVRKLARDSPCELGTFELFLCSGKENKNEKPAHVDNTLKKEKSTVLVRMGLSEVNIDMPIVNLSLVLT